MSNPMIDTDKIQQAIAVALVSQRMAKEVKAAPEDNPMHGQTLEGLVRGSGILKHADLLPQKDKHGNWLGPNNLNQQVVDGLEARTKGRQDQRKKASRARAERIEQINKEADDPKVPDPARLVQAWAVLRPLVPIVARIARSKGAWARRYLGAISDDIGQNAMESMVKVLAKSDKYDLDVLAMAAKQLGGEAERGGVPKNQEVESEQVNEDAARKQRRKEAKARKWLMGMVNNRVMGALCEAYKATHNLKWENLDLIETVMASINGAGDDPLMARFSADRAPFFIGSKMPAPGVLDPNVLAMALAGAITDRKLDRLVMLLTDEERLQTNGAFMWNKYAEDVFMATEDGEHKWNLVVNATAHYQTTEGMAKNGQDGPREARARAAMLYARQQFEFLEWLIPAIINSCDARPLGWRVDRNGGTRAVMASDFDPDSFAEDGSRQRPGYLVPRPVFRDLATAAQVIREYLGTVIVEVI